MLICEDVTTDADIAAIRAYARKRQQKFYSNWLNQDGTTLDRRLSIDQHSPEFSIIAEIVGRYFRSWDRIWSAYQLQNQPHNIHVDEYGHSVDSTKPCYTFILAFDTVPEFTTVIWKEQFHTGQQFAQWITEHWIPNRQSMPKTNTHELYDLEHTYDENNQDYVCDYLTFEGSWSYVKGQAVLFNGEHLHCSSNWRKYTKFDHRELLQIHVLSDDPLCDI